MPAAFFVWVNIASLLRIRLPGLLMSYNKLFAVTINCPRFGIFPFSWRLCACACVCVCEFRACGTHVGRRKNRNVVPDEKIIGVSKFNCAYVQRGHKFIGT